jgi:hypothetical protein
MLEPHLHYVHYLKFLPTQLALSRIHMYMTCAISDCRLHYSEYLISTVFTAHDGSHQLHSGLESLVSYETT